MKRMVSLALMLVLLLGMFPAIALAEGNENSDGGSYEALRNLLRDAFGFSEKIGTVAIEKSGYMNAYKRNDKKSGIVFRVHRGERFSCMEETEDGWYRIQFIDGSFGYVSQEGTALDRDATDDITFSSPNLAGVFDIRTTRRATVYSQPRGRAQSKRETADGEYTFYMKTGMKMTAFGKTVREEKEWYVIRIAGQGSNNVPEIVWLLASDCEVLHGDPDVNIIPAWWYD